MYGKQSGGGNNNRGGSGGANNRGGGNKNRGSRESKKKQTGTKTKRSNDEESHQHQSHDDYFDYDDYGNDYDDVFPLLEGKLGSGGGGGGRGGGRNNKNNKKKEKKKKNIIIRRQQRDNDNYNYNNNGNNNSTTTNNITTTVSVSDDVFTSWEALLNSREDLHQRLNSIAAVHGWEKGRCVGDDDESSSTTTTFLYGGIVPASLISAARDEVEALLGPAVAVELERVDLALMLRQSRDREETLADERERLALELAAIREECFEAQEELAGRNDELNEMRVQLAAAVIKRDANQAAAGSDLSCSNEGGDKTANCSDDDCATSSDSTIPAAGSAMFETILPRNQFSEGRRVVESLARLKLPDEASMGPQELACWQENKKTITNSLRTISGQIYNSTQRILYEIIQNADDCSFVLNNNEDEGVVGSAKRELYLECSDDALVVFHNERGFQPKDLYSMCQVGESSKAPGSGKIGRKGIGFKSVFQICDRPVVVSPPFSFCFDTVKHGQFGFIVPSWVDIASEFEPQRMPLRHRDLLRRIFPNLDCDDGGTTYSTASETGTLLVCPKAPRIRRLDLMRDHDFDGLSLAFLKNLEKITFISSTTAHLRNDEDGVVSGGHGGEACDVQSTSHEYRVERTPILLDNEPDQYAVAGTVLKGIAVVSHELFQITIVERISGGSTGRVSEVHRYYRLHSYTVMKYKSDAASSSPALAESKTTTINLAFPINSDLLPHRPEEGELVFAYLPVTSAGFGFAINADFELVASRQDLQDNHGGNHVLLGRIPTLFVHAILTDPVLGEDSFSTYLPDVDIVRQEARSGGGRKWYTLALALHRETAAWMTIPTEDAPEKVKRHNAVLRPHHLSLALVSNRTLKAVTGRDMNFAHADAVKNMCLESCLPVVPVATVIDCIRYVLESAGTDGIQEDDRATNNYRAGAGDVTKRIKEKTNFLSHGTDLSIPADVLLDIWRYLTVEYTSSVLQAEKGRKSLRLIAEALIGEVQSAGSLPPLRIFPVRGSARLRLHSEHGVPLCLGLSPSLTEQGEFVTHLAKQVIPFLDSERLKGVGEIKEMTCFLRFLQLHDATAVDLQSQIKNCFHFGLVAAVDVQLWWDSYRYALSLGHKHGLKGLMPNIAIALPLQNTRFVSSQDAQGLSVTSLPCILGLHRKPTRNTKYILAVPPSASTWGERIMWELAIEQSFGLSYSKADAEHLSPQALSIDLLYAVVDARDQGDMNALRALSDLLGIYERRMGALVPMLRGALELSQVPEDCLFERRTIFQPFSLSCSPDFIAELLASTNVTKADPSYHDLLDLLGECLGVLQLRQARSDQEPEGGGYSYHDISKASNKVIWDVLARLLGFQSSFTPTDSARLLYSVLTPVFLKQKDEDAPKEIEYRTFLFNLSQTAFSSNSDSVKQLWPHVCTASGMWLGSDFVSLERCIWNTEGGGIWEALTLTGCKEGPIVAVEPALLDLMKGSVCSDLIKGMSNVCTKGLMNPNHHGVKTPSLPHPSDLDMMVDSVLPWLLERDGVGKEGHFEGFSDEIYMCYDAVLSAVKSGLPPGRRWQLPVPSASMCLLHVVVDRRPPRQKSMKLVVTRPDSTSWPMSTTFCLQHFSSSCLHPALAPLFADVVDRQSVGLETPRARIQRCFKHCLRLAYNDDDSVTHCHNGANNSRCDGVDMVWALVGEVFEQPVSPTNSSQVLSQLSDDNKWELLLWAAITCATQWCRMRDVGTPEDAARYQDTLSRVRQLVPFIETKAEGRDARWSFLSERHFVTDDASGEVSRINTADSNNTAPILLLGSLFGFNLWENVGGLELFNRMPSFTVGIPSSFLANTSRSQNPDSNYNFPETFEQSSLLLIWEWFLLEVAEAQPPSVLWAAAQTPIIEWVRPRIRSAEASIRDSLETPPQNMVDRNKSPFMKSLLESILEKTQISQLLGQMDAIDEARREAAAREAETMRRERQAIQERRRLAAAARQREQRLERERERRLADASHLRTLPLMESQREQIRSERADTDTGRPAQRSTPENQPPFAFVSSSVLSLVNRFAPTEDVDNRTTNNNVAAPPEQLDLTFELMSLVPPAIVAQFAAATNAGNNPVQRHVTAPTMPQSNVKGKLMRFLAGMRAYERQQPERAQRFPSVLSEFVAWAGDFVAGEVSAANREGDGSNQRNPAQTEEAARRYLNLVGARGRHSSSATLHRDEDEVCIICLMKLHDGTLYDEIGEPVKTACGHCFHAICFARLFEASENGVWCPLCRSGDLSARFVGN